MSKGEVKNPEKDRKLKGNEEQGGQKGSRGHKNQQGRAGKR